MENGHFGSNENRSSNNQSNNRSRTDIYRHRERHWDGFENLCDVHSPIFYVNIICIAAIAIFVIVVCFNWQDTSDFIFKYILFPIIDIVFSILSKFLIFGTIILGIRHWLKRKFFHFR